MSRCLVVLAALGLPGCDQVFGLEAPMVGTVCGRFGPERPVNFGSELSGITDFSFNRDRTRGFAHATVTTSMVQRTGPVPLRYEPTADRWDFDPQFEANWAVLAGNDRVRVARITRDDELFVGQQLTTSPPTFRVFHYGWQDTQWAPLDNMEIAPTTNTNAFPGGLLSQQVFGGAVVNYLPIFRSDAFSDGNRSVSIAVKQSSATTWTDQEVIGGVASTDAINMAHAPWSGALAQLQDGETTRQVLVYAATPSDEVVDSDLYIATKRSGGFVVGEPLGFNTDDEELEPWISEDCTVLTFRRTERGAAFEGTSRGGGTIFEATVE